MDEAGSQVNIVGYKSLSLPGSMITRFVSMASLLLLVFFLCVLIYGIWMREELYGFIRDVGPIALISAAIWYLCFSFRIVISRNQDSVIIYRQFLAPQIQYLRREYSVDSLTVDQVTHRGGEDGKSTTYTTLYNNEEVIVKYTGHKRKLNHVLPELLTDKRDSVENKNPTTKEFW